MYSICAYYHDIYIMQLIELVIEITCAILLYHVVAKLHNFFGKVT